MKTIVIIPARYHSMRFPGKPLVKLGDKSMIQLVYEQAKKAKSIHEVIVATDDQRIVDEVNRFGGKVVMTSHEHPSGTDRCAEVLSTLADAPDAIVNVQGDEPFIHPEQIDQMAALLAQPQVQIATLARKITEYNHLHDHAKVKVVFDRNKKAIYFSRYAIPFQRNAMDQNWLHLTNYYHHIGIYGYKASVLKEITALSPSHLEKAESLEQLRWIENGYSIHLDITSHESFGIDTPEDLQVALSKLPK